MQISLQEVAGKTRGFTKEQRRAWLVKFTDEATKEEDERIKRLLVPPKKEMNTQEAMKAMMNEPWVCRVDPFFMSIDDILDWVEVAETHNDFTEAPYPRPKDLPKICYMNSTKALRRILNPPWYTQLWGWITRTNS